MADLNADQEIEIGATCWRSIDLVLTFYSDIMDPVTITEEVVSLVACPTFDALKECWKYVKEYDSNIDEVQDKYKSLKNLKDEIIQKVELAERKNKTVVPTVKEWIEGVEKFMDPKQEEWNDLLLETETRKKADECCFGSCWSPTYRYNLSKKAVGQASNIKKKMEEMLERGTNPVALDAKPVELTSVSSSFLKGLNSREKILSDIMRKLKDDNVNKIGIHGMGGSGKTTLVQELARRCEGEKMFDAIFIAEISEVPDFKRIQDEIADRIGFSTLERYHGIKERAINLSNRLMQIRKRKGLYMNNERNDVRDAEKPDGVKIEGKYLNKAPTIHHLNKITSSKEKKLILYNPKDQFEITEEGQLKPTKEVENDERGGLEKGKYFNEEMKQGGTEKNGKLLVILDNMWKNLDLRLVGIPYELEIDLGCKVIMTSRNEVVCKEMGASNSCTFKVGDLDHDEAMKLFREEVGEIAHNDIYTNIITKLLKKCSYLPLSISLIANTLKNQPLPIWEHVLKQLENPIEEETLGIFGQIYSVIELSYKLLSSKEKKMFFLLCCIFPPGSIVHVTNLLRYGIGLDLFEHVDSIVEAIDQAYRWANDLKSLSLLSEVDVRKGVITIHDDVRKAGKSFAAKGDYAFHVGDIPKWMKSYSYQKYKAISMMSNSYEHLDARTLPELQFLRSLSMDSSKLSQRYFTGMQWLKVLDMSDSIIENFPSSFGDLSKLEILLLERCCLKEFSEIWKLVKLLVLSFKESNITCLPEEMKYLVELKLLDLTNCQQLKSIPCGMFAYLKQLEGLYMKDSFSNWTTSGRGASLAELACMSLKVLEIDIQSTSQLPDGDFPNLGVINYKIGLVESTPQSSVQDQIIFSRDLVFGGVHACDLIKEGWKPLLLKSESLYLYEVEDLENICPYLGEYWSDLKRIDVSNSGGLQYLINPKAGFQSIVFPELEYLRLEGVKLLEAIYNGKSPIGFFSSLQELILLGLSELLMCNIDIGSATRLRVLEVKNCDKLVSIFSTSIAVQSQGHGEINKSSEMQFPLLEKLILANLPALKGLFAQENAEDTKRFLFPMQVIFPYMDKIKLKRLPQIGELWDIATMGKEFVTRFPELRSISLKYLNSIQYIWKTATEVPQANFSSGKLKKVKILACDSIVIAFPLFFAIGLHELELLRVNYCDKVKQVISSDRESGEKSMQTMIFSKLLTLNLGHLQELTYFYDGKVKIGFPVLRTLKLHNLPKMKTLLTKVEPAEKSKANQKVGECRKKNGDTLFNGEVQFPFLETLYVKYLNNIKRLWESESQPFTKMFPNLQELYIYSLGNLKHVWNEDLTCATTSVSINLKKLYVKDCVSLESLFAPSLASSYTNIAEVEFPKLEVIEMESLSKFSYFSQGNVKLKLPVLKIIYLGNMTKMVAFSKREKSSSSSGEELGKKDDGYPPVPLLNKEISIPLLECLTLEELPMVAKLWDMTNIEEFSRAFPCLETLVVNGLPEVSYVWSDELSEKNLHFGSLKSLSINKCNKMESLFSHGKISCSPPLDQEQYQKVVSFPRLETLILSNLQSFKCLVQPQCLNMEFQALKVLNVGHLPLVKTMLQLRNYSGTKKVIQSNKKKNSDESNYREGDDPIKPYFPGTREDSINVDPVLFKGKVEFTSLETLIICCMFELESITYEYEGGVQNVNVATCSSIFPALKQLSLHGVDVIKMKRILETMLHKLQFLSIDNFKNLVYLVSSDKDKVSSGEALVKSISELENLEELVIKKCDSLKGLFQVDQNLEDNDVALLRLSLKSLTLSQLANLKFVQWHMLRNIQSLTIEYYNATRGKKTFLFSATSVARGLWLQSLECMTIICCNNIESIIGGQVELQDDAYKIIFPRLKEVKLEDMVCLRMFSSTEGGTIRLPSLESIEFQRCGILTTFSSDPVEAPKLCNLKVNNKQLISTTRGDPNSVVQCEFDSKYKITKHWPRKLESNLDKEDYVVLKVTRNGKPCYACGKDITKYSYSCGGCEIDLHPECAMVVSQLDVVPDEIKAGKDLLKTLRHESHEHELRLVAGRPHFCDGCGQTGELFSYYCDKCDFDLHPKCALEGSSDEHKLENEINALYDITLYWPKSLMHRSDEHELKLVAGVDYLCNKCHEVGKQFSYTCEVCEFSLHTYCALDENQLNVIPDEMKVGNHFLKVLRHESHEHELRLVAGRSYICDGCGQRWGELFSYYCKTCDFDLHPKCALEGSSDERKLENEINALFDDITQYWPKTLMHRSDEHELKLVTGVNYLCNKCDEVGKKFSYTCEVCEFSLHTDCALDENQLNVIPDEMKVGNYFLKMLRHESHEHELRLVAGRTYMCDGCFKSGELFSYYCEACDFDLHPKCALEGSSVESIPDEITTEV